MLKSHTNAELSTFASCNRIREINYIQRSGDRVSINRKIGPSEHGKIGLFSGNILQNQGELTALSIPHDDAHYFVSNLKNKIPTSLPQPHLNRKDLDTTNSKPENQGLWIGREIGSGQGFDSHNHHFLLEKNCSLRFFLRNSMAETKNKKTKKRKRHPRDELEQLLKTIVVVGWNLANS